MSEDPHEVAPGSALPGPLQRSLTERLGWICAVAAMAVHGVLMATGQVATRASFALPLFVVAFFAVPVILRRGGSLAAATTVLLSALLVAILGLAAWTGGLASPALALLPAVTILAVLLSNLRAALWTVVGAAIGLVGLGATLPADAPLVMARGSSAAWVRALSLVGSAALVLGLAWLYERELARLGRLLRAASTRDPLTGLANRGSLDDALALEHFRKSRHPGSALSVILFDIDYFEEYADSHGRQAADELVRKVAETARLRVRRAPDLLGRHGDFEMLAILPATAGADATILAECVRRDIEALELPNPAALRGLVTVSLGVAAQEAGSEGSIDALLSEAGQALRRAKLEGRNRVCTAPPTVAVQRSRES